MVYEKKTYQLHRTISFLMETGLSAGCFCLGYMDGQDFSQSFFCVYRLNSLVGGQGVGTEQTVALRCVRALLVLSLVLVVQSAWLLV